VSECLAKMTGRPIVLIGYPKVPGATLDARGAAAEALRCFLAGVEFHRDGGPNMPSTPFVLNAVYDAWPGPGTQLDYPCAVVTDPQLQSEGAHNMSPTSLDETWNVYGDCTVLWKLAELEAEFQVDFFTNDEPTRQAIMAALPGAMSPEEDRYGVVVEGTPRYFDRAVRLTLLSYRRPDTAGAVFDLERRIVCRVSADIDVVVLRKAVAFEPRISVAVVAAEDE
jgi:hypothetical protein